MTKHTEGPWQSLHDNSWDGRCTIIGAIDGPDDGQMHYTVVCDVDEAPDEWAENIKLICAAPDLLAALERAVSWFDEYAAGHRIKGAVEKAERNQLRADSLRAAIARATGAA